MPATNRDDRIETVVAELNQLLVRLIDRAFEPLGKEGPKDLPFLYGLAEDHNSDLWRSGSRERALEELILHASLKLEGRFGGSGAISNQEAVFWLFNLQGGSIFPHIKKRGVETLGGSRGSEGGDKKYSEILQDLIRRAKLENQSESTTRRSLTKLRRALAVALLDLGSVDSVENSGGGEPAGQTDGGAASGNEDLSARPLLADFYVARPEYEAEIRRVRQSATRLVWLHGDAGTGKTRLARAASSDTVAEHLVPVLHASSPARLEQDVATLIATSGIDPGVVNRANVWATFNRLLSQNEAPEVIVIDDLPSDTDILDRIGATGRTLLIFTSQYPPPANFRGHTWRVDELTPAERDAMLRSRLPHSTDGERGQLARSLGGRPLAIEHSCAFIREAEISVGEYCEALAQQPAATLDAAGEKFGRTLTQIYSLTVQRLSSSFDTLRALDLIVFTGVITTEVLADAWVEGLELPPSFKGSGKPDDDYIHSASLWCATWPGVRWIDGTRFPKTSALDRVRLQAALRRIESFGLVRSDYGLLVMHQLTRAILGSIRETQADNIYARISTAVYELVRAENWRGGEALTFARLWWAPYLRTALEQRIGEAGTLANASTDELIRLTTLGAVTMRAHRQLGASAREFYRLFASTVLATFKRLRDESAEIEDRERLEKALTDGMAEMFEFVYIDHGVDRPVTILDGAADPQLRSVADSTRLKFHTEWELSHHFTDPAKWESLATRARHFAQGEGATPEGVRISAKAAIVVSSVYYDQAKWTAAIEALEHAYSCYLQIGASVECIRGAMDAARRLSRVNLRAGRLEDAGAWLDRAYREVYLPRCKSTFRGKPSPFLLQDTLLETQMSQSKMELELTKEVLKWDSGDIPDDEAASSSMKSRSQEARRLLRAVLDLRFRRVGPELALHALRIDLLAGSAVRPGDQWFSPEENLYQSDLEKLQRAVFAVPSIALALSTTNNEFQDMVQGGPAEVVDNLSAMRQDPLNTMWWLKSLTDTMVRSKHNNPYWYARGLCATAIVGLAGDGESPKVRRILMGAKEWAEVIGRPDWGEKLDSYGTDNEAMWLLGY